MEKMYNAVKTWFDGGKVNGIKRPETPHILHSLLWGLETIYHNGEYKTICQDEIKYWKHYGFIVETSGIGWKIRWEV